MPPPPNRPARRNRRGLLGAAGERCAAAYLSARGYEILERNYRRSWGEADIVARAPDRSLVIVEVRARSDQRYVVEAAYSIGPRKQLHLRRLALGLLAEQADQDDEADVRIDVMIVAPNRRGHLEVVAHIEGAFDDEESDDRFDD